MRHLKSIELKSFARRPHVSAKYTLQGFDVVVLSHKLPYFVMLSYERYREIESALKSANHPYADTFSNLVQESAPPAVEVLSIRTKAESKAWAEKELARIKALKGAPASKPLEPPDEHEPPPEPLGPPSMPVNGKIW